MENKKDEHAELTLLAGIISSGHCMQIFCPQIASLKQENPGTNPSQNWQLQKRHATVVGAFDYFCRAELSSTVKLIRMASPHGVVVSLAYLLFLLTRALTTAISQKEPDNDNTSSGVSNTQSKCHNVYTSNNFYAGPNKKIEAMLLVVKEDLREIREEIKSLKENRTVCKGKPESPSWGT